MRFCGAGLVMAVAVLAGCSSQAPSPVETPSAAPSVDVRGAALVEALKDPHNVEDPASWADVSQETLVAHAKAVCADLGREGMPVAEVWQAEMARDGVSMSDADYFTRASAQLFCPRFQREAGYLS